jgi:hypothetical protein
MAIVDKEGFVRSCAPVSAVHALSIILMIRPQIEDIKGKKLRAIFDPVAVSPWQ